MSVFTVTILGSSSALPTLNRFQAAHLVNIDERPFLVDCGEGTQMQLRRFKTKMSRINHVFISHLHGDHTFGLPGLISTLAMQGRENDIHIHAQGELEKILQPIIDFYFEGLPFKIHFHPIGSSNPGVLYEDEKIIVSGFTLKHRIPTTGFLFKEKPRPGNMRKDMLEKYRIPIKDIQAIRLGADFMAEGGVLIPNSALVMPSKPLRSYAYCSDTAPAEKVIRYIEGVSTLFHEATFLERDKKRAKETYHSTASQAANVALKSQVGKLIIGHYSTRYKDVLGHLEEARKIFPETYLANDGDVFEV